MITNGALALVRVSGPHVPLETDRAGRWLRRMSKRRDLVKKAVPLRGEKAGH